MTLEFKQPSVTYNGKTYELELASVESTFIGFEGHGLFSFNIGFNLGGAYQGLGHYMVGANGEYLGQLVRLTLKVFGVDSWESLKLKKVYVMREEKSRFGQIVGLLSLDHQRILLYTDIFPQVDRPV